MHVTTYLYMYSLIVAYTCMHTHTFVVWLADMMYRSVRKCQQPYQKHERTKERHNDRHNLQTIWRNTKNKIKHLSEVIPQSVCAEVPLFQVYQQPNWGPVRGQAMTSHTYICTCVCGGRRVMNLLHVFHESSWEKYSNKCQLLFFSCMITQLSPPYCGISGWKPFHNRSTRRVSQQHRGLLRSIEV